MKNKPRFSHLSYEERVVLGMLVSQKESIRSIARVLGRSPNTISYELRKKRVRGEYIVKKAQAKTYLKRYLSKRGSMKLAIDPKLQDFVIEKLKSLWSPQRISGFLRRYDTAVSKKAIYKFVDSRCLERHLFLRGRKRKKKTSHWKTLNNGKRYIESRPFLDGSGHLEADFIVSTHNTVSLLVIVDRYTRLTKIRRLPNRKHATVSRVLSEVLQDFPVKTLTVDNDIAFSAWKQLEKVLGTPIYFCHPYHSWEKGLVENTNRWIRVFVPKKRDLAEVTDNECRSIEDYLNNTPRECLNYLTANELHLKGQLNSVSGVS